MLSHHSWPRSMRRLDSIIERCLGGFGRRSPAQQLGTLYSQG
jgi:hypothetical protein